MTSLVIEYYTAIENNNQNNPSQHLYNVLLKHGDTILDELHYVNLDHFTKIRQESEIKIDSVTYPLDIEYSALVLEYNTNGLLNITLVNNSDFLLKRHNIAHRGYKIPPDSIKVYPLFGKKIKSMKQIETEPFIEFGYESTIDKSYTNIGMVFLLVSFVTPILYYLLGK